MPAVTHTVHQAETRRRAISTGTDIAQLNKAHARRWATQLRRQIDDHDYRHYASDAPIISDAEHAEPKPTPARDGTKTGDARKHETRTRSEAEFLRLIK